MPSGAPAPATTLSSGEASAGHSRRHDSGGARHSCAQLSTCSGRRTPLHAASCLHVLITTTLLTCAPRSCRRLAASNAAKVFVTDNIITTLMCIRSSIYSWDIVITRTGDKLFLDLRSDSNLNMLTVNETAPEAVPEDKDNMNGVQQLGLEATAINQNFSQQVRGAGDCVCAACTGGCSSAASPLGHTGIQHAPPAALRAILVHPGSNTRKRMLSAPPAQPWMLCHDTCSRCLQRLSCH